MMFPTNVFRDVLPSDFNKLNKKHVTEDFVAENFKLLGWSVYTPFNDTGIDLIIEKIVKKDGSTPLDKSEQKENNECVKITRFIQIKTRNLVNNIFGFTLRSKDIRTDPRHVFLLYSDKTTSTQQDFLIITIHDLLEFFKSTNHNPFASFTFRKGNAKMNDLKYNTNDGKFYWKDHSWEAYRNFDGLKKISDPKIDLELDTFSKETRSLSNELLNDFSRGQTFPSQDFANKVKTFIMSNRAQRSDPSYIVKLRKRVKEYLKLSITDQAVIDSMDKYTEYILSKSDSDNEE